MNYNNQQSVSSQYRFRPNIILPYKHLPVDKNNRKIHSIAVQLDYFKIETICTVPTKKSNIF